MHTRERCIEGGADDTGGVANIACISKITNVLKLTIQLEFLWLFYYKCNKLNFVKNALFPFLTGALQLRAAFRKPKCQNLAL